MSEPQTVIEKGWNWDVEIGSISPLEWWILRFDEAGINTKNRVKFHQKITFASSTFVVRVSPFIILTIGGRTLSQNIYEKGFRAKWVRICHLWHVPRLIFVFVNNVGTDCFQWLMVFWFLRHQNQLPNLIFRFSASSKIPFCSNHSTLNVIKYYQYII